MADLTALACLRLSRAGVSTIAGGDRCTHGEPEIFFFPSARGTRHGTHGDAGLVELTLELHNSTLEKRFLGPPYLLSGKADPQSGVKGESDAQWTS